MEKLIDNTGKEFPGVFTDTIDGKDVLVLSERNDANGGAITQVSVPDGNGSTFGWRHGHGLGQGFSALKVGYEGFDPPAWDAGAAYGLAATVKGQGGLSDTCFISLQKDNLGHEPGTSGQDLWWQVMKRAKTDAELLAAAANERLFFASRPDEELAVIVSLATDPNIGTRKTKIAALDVLERGRRIGRTPEEMAAELPAKESAELLAPILAWREIRRVATGAVIES